jgi:hypothetical protein
MMYPYAEFLLDFERKHGAFKHHNAPENSLAAVIVETRPFFFLPRVVRNVMHFLGPRWNLHVFCGEASHGYVQSFLDGWGANVVKFPRQRHLSVAEYNGVLTSPSFWQRFTEEKVLVFQTDSLLSSDGVDAFLGYDFIGAPCGRFDEQYIANGGLSLRTRRVMLECIARERPAGDLPEDVYFTRAVRALGARMPDLATATRFAVESIYTSHPFGVHGTDKCFHSEQVAKKIVAGIRY